MCRYFLLNESGETVQAALGQACVLWQTKAQEGRALRGAL